VRSHARCDETGSIERIGAVIVKTGLADLTVLIHSIQKAEGNEDCFRRPKGPCDQFDCAWRAYCLEEPRDESSDQSLSPSQGQSRGERKI